MVSAWRQVSKDFNRCLQNLRRLHGGELQYIRTVEAHQDLYPHLHAVLQFKDGLWVENGKYFEKRIYQKWRELWTRGHSDYQAPHQTSIYPTLYIIKYITKSHATKTLWKKMFSDQKRVMSVPTADQNMISTSKPSTVALIENPSLFFCKQFKIKQVTWSRGYKFPKIQRQQPRSLLVEQSLLSPSNN